MSALLSLAWLSHDPLTQWMVQVAAIVSVSQLIYTFARRIDQPRVVAEISAGILLGPSLLGLASPEVARALFPPESLQPLGLVSQVGLVLFMFIVGLEFDASLLRARKHASVVISHSSILAPFAIGALLGARLHAQLAPPGVTRLTFGLFMGAAMSITAFPVLARILTERRLVQTRIGGLTLACAAVDDVTAWCILAFVVTTARATGTTAAIATTVLALAYVAAMIWVVRPMLARWIARARGPHELREPALWGILLLLLLSSWTTEQIGIHALFGAFLFGAILPRQGGLARSLSQRLQDLVLVLLLPLFFAYSGVRTEIGLLDSPEKWAICGLLILAASLGKWGAGMLAARCTGSSWREAAAIGVLINTRGLMELIVLNIGLDLGVISPTVFTMMVLMALATTFATTPFLQWILPAGSRAVEFAEPPPLPLGEAQSGSS